MTVDYRYCLPITCCTLAKISTSRKEKGYLATNIIYYCYRAENCTQIRNIPKMLFTKPLRQANCSSPSSGTFPTLPPYPTQHLFLSRTTESWTRCSAWGHGDDVVCVGVSILALLEITKIMWWERITHFFSLHLGYWLIRLSSNLFSHFLSLFCGK